MKHSLNTYVSSSIWNLEIIRGYTEDKWDLELSQMSVCVQKLFCILVLVFIVFNTPFCSVEAAKIS